jgi:serine/threonine protein kinase
MGGMGVVVSAYDSKLDGRVAIKVLRPDRLAQGAEEGTRRLLREAQAMARLSHPKRIPANKAPIPRDDDCY